MKNKKLITAIAALLKVDEATLLTSMDNEAGDDTVVKEYTDKFQAYKAEDLAKLIKNANEQAIEKYFDAPDFDIDKHIPSAIHKKIKGVSFENFEKAMARKHGITEYDGLDDLIAKLVVKSNDGKGKPDEALLSQIETLKKTVEEKENEVNEVKNKYVQDEINRNFDSALSQLPLSFEGEALERQRDLLRSAFLAQHKLDRKGETIVVMDAKGTRLNDKLGDPEPITNVLTNFAKTYGFPFKEQDAGGRGSGSSQSSGAATNILKGKTFQEVVNDKVKTLPAGTTFDPHGADGIALFAEWQKQNN